MGKEAFLSASGKLSMINAPSWGSWKAPASGTVIPAHLTKHLDIPSGGININSAAPKAAAATGNMTGLVRAIHGIANGGDSIQNNVTIQTANPNQTANSVMTQLAKLRHVRYH